MKKSISLPDFMVKANNYFSNDGPVTSKQTTTFSNNMKLPVHRWYRYSAGYSAQWAKELVALWDGRNVLDPFGGSGTTALAAQEIGRTSKAVEIHPTVARIASAKLHWNIDPEEVNNMGSTVLKVATSSHARVNIPASPLVAKCFPDQEALTRLLRIRDTVLALPNGNPVSEIAWLAFVSIIRATSPAGTAQWQYVLPNKKKSRVAEPFTAFDEIIQMFVGDMIQRQSEIGVTPSSAEILRIDARTLEGIPDNWADVVITSPPYANNYDYADALRLEQIVLGDIEGWSDLRPLRDKLVRSATQNLGRWDPSEALDSCLLEPIIDEFTPVYDELTEVRKTRGGNKAYNKMLAGYFYDNAKVFRALRQKTSPGAKVCYVVGDSAPYGVHAPVERWLGELAIAAGFKSWSFFKVRDRNNKWKNRKHNHPLHEGYLWIEG